MSKPAAIFVAAAMAVTAGCVAVIASHGLGLDLGAAMLAGFAALGGMAVTHLAFLRAAPREDRRIDEIDDFVTELHGRLETVELRLSTIDGAGAERARAATRPLVDEIAALGALVTTVAKEVAAHDVALSGLRAAATERASAPDAPPAAPTPVVAPPVLADHPAPQFVLPSTAPAPTAEGAPGPAETASEPSGPRKIAPPEPFDPDAEEAAQDAAAPTLAARIDRALAEDRIEAHLQPIVALPSRRTAHYEAFSRLAEADGLLAAQDFLGEAAGRTLAEIDRRTIERCAAVALRLSARGGGAVFCNLAPSTLADAAALAALTDLFERQAELRRLIVLEMAQAAAASLGGPERAALDAFTTSGVRLSLDRVEDLAVDPRDLARRGVRFVKVAAARLLDPEAVKGAAIHPADLSSLLARHGVDLIATHVEEERTVPELLDMEVRFAQGHLFGVPRPARPAAPEPRPEPAAKPARLVPRSVGAR